MNPLMVLGPGMTAAVITLAGLIIRGRWRWSFFLGPYLLGVLTYAILTLGWPETCWNVRSYMASQAVSDTLKLAMALEIGWRTFRLFPGARQTAERMTCAILVITATSALVVAAGPDPFFVAITLVTPREQCGVLWVMVTTLVVALWYRVPIHPFNVVLLTSFVAYQATSGVLIAVLATGFDDLRDYFSILDNAAWQLAAAAWA